MAGAGYKYIEYGRSLGLRGPTQQIGLVLSTYADKDGCAWPSVATLASASGVSERMTPKALKNLEALGVIEIEVGGGRGKTSRYWFTLKPPKATTPELEKLFYDDAKMGIRGSPEGIQFIGVSENDSTGV